MLRRNNINIKWHWLIVIFILGLIFWFEHEARKPKILVPMWLSYLDLPFKVGNKPNPGEEIILYIKRCNSTKITQHYFLTRSIYSEDGKIEVVLGGQYVEIPPGCSKPDAVSRVNVIPLNLPRGLKYYLRGKGVQSDTLQSVEWRSELFEVPL